MEIVGILRNENGFAPMCYKYCGNSKETGAVSVGN